MSLLKNDEGNFDTNIKALEDIQKYIGEVLSTVEKERSKFLSSTKTTVRITPEEELFLDYVFSDLPNKLDNLIKYNKYFMSLLKNESLRSGIKCVHLK